MTGAGADLAPATRDVVTLRVSRRMLWVGEAAYPTRNITRIHTYLLAPARGRIIRRHLACLAVVAIVALGLYWMVNAGGSPFDSETDGSPLAIGVIVGLSVLVSLAVRLSAAAKHVLEIETASGSRALVTLARPDHLRRLAEELTHVIENPQADYHVNVEGLSVNLKNYVSGTQINQYGNQNRAGLL
ncbi:DUF6232 family protein [Streptomyces sp. NPDC047974]|uniref:DUF6232 family protein n=1 Tax=Streptomyces sp. NPDC047974 TaxID=3154343 RepID=UPI0033F6E30F